MAYTIRLEDMARLTQFPGWDEVLTAFDAELAALPEGEQPRDDSPRAIRLRGLGIGGR